MHVTTAEIMLVETVIEIKEWEEEKSNKLDIYR